MLANTSLLDGTTTSYSAIDFYPSHSMDLNNSNSSTTGTNTTNGSYFYDPNQSIKNTLTIIQLTLCSVGIVLNILSILAVLHIPREINNHLKLIMNLAVSDGLMLLTVIVHKQILFFTADPQRTYLLMMGRQIFNTFAYATLINLLGMSVDHYIAIMIPLRYNMYTSTTRSNCMILIGWLISIFVGFLDKIIVCFIKEDGVSVWEAVLNHYFSSELVVLSFVPVVCIVVMVIYMRVYCVVRGLVRSQQRLNTDEAHNYKATVTTFLIIGTFILCWIPHLIFQVVMLWLSNSHLELVKSKRQTFMIIDNIFFLILLTNCLCDPIIYAVRLGQVQQGFRRMLKKFCPFFDRLMHRQDFQMMSKSSRGRRKTEETIIRDETSRNGQRNSITRRVSSLTPISTLYVSEDVDMKPNPYEMEEKINNNPNTTVGHVYKVDSIDQPDEIDVHNGKPDTDWKCKTISTNKDDCQSINSAGTYLTQTSPLSNKEFWPENETTSLM